MVITLLTDLLIGALTRFVNVANTVELAEDNCPENGEYIYCLDKTTPPWISIYDVYKEEKFICLRQPNTNKFIKLSELK
ncbi:hypothetical protein [Clostridium botulinum]|uniref:hypothetical protein n=1 Tax=Clostridium botulinum TaxID=1491 RepID=UPI0009B3D5A3|nr:hypothetical protein [Clostridium botulinum]MBY6950544.1 hypothetical protein [Clostridium botulinum]MCR1139292.1 hypothetical protein [Clostridium botulinum]NEZ80563.1 hypothetical protein [Clostridium botulinum]NFA16815.1 hypothetical protein [Clostridium botulinum]NFA52940.1 hypothetical protein [Clostridium botulinum]